MRLPLAHRPYSILVRFPVLWYSRDDFVPTPFLPHDF